MAESAPPGPGGTAEDARGAVFTDNPPATEVDNQDVFHGIAVNAFSESQGHAMGMSVNSAISIAKEYFESGRVMTREEFKDLRFDDDMRGELQEAVEALVDAHIVNNIASAAGDIDVITLSDFEAFTS
jgi:hypothetical protein